MSYTIPSFSLPEIKSASAYAFDALVNEIRQFQNILSRDMEVGIVADGGGQTIHVESLRSSGQMIVFDGVDNQGHAARLIQHYTQINVQMIAVKKLESEARRIGF